MDKDGEISRNRRDLTPALQAHGRAGYETLVKRMDLKATWLVNLRKGLAEEYDALKQQEKAAKFRVEADALDSRADSAKK